MVIYLKISYLWRLNHFLVYQWSHSRHAWKQQQTSSSSSVKHNSLAPLFLFFSLLAFNNRRLRMRRCSLAFKHQLIFIYMFIVIYSHKHETRRIQDVLRRQKGVINLPEACEGSCRFLESTKYALIHLTSSHEFMIVNESLIHSHDKRKRSTHLLIGN